MVTETFYKTNLFFYGKLI